MGEAYATFRRLSSIKCYRTLAQAVSREGRGLCPISAKIRFDLIPLFPYFVGTNALDEDWRILVSMLPPSWQRTARLSGAVERLRGFDSVNEVLRVLLMHVGGGYSLRETAGRAQAAGLAEVSDVTLLNRLRQAEGWLQHLCQALLEESGVCWRGPQPRRRVRAVDGTVIKEPGPTGSHWRIHFSLRLPELTCDHWVITATKGGNTAENAALLTQKLVRLGSSISPWGYDLGSTAEVQPVA